MLLCDIISMDDIIIGVRDVLVSMSDVISSNHLSPSRYLSDLPDHLPDDRGARCGGVCVPAPPAGPRHGHHLLRHANQNQPHLQNLRTGQEVGDSSQIHKPHLPARYHLHPHFCPGKWTQVT